ncbi:MAG: imelysin family protein [Pseudomonadales bacterium]
MKNKNTTTFIYLYFSLLVTACSPPKPPALQLLESIANHSILPFHQQFVTSTRRLHNSSNNFCEDKTEQQLQMVRSHWLLAMKDWQAVKVIQFGPVTVDNQNWKIQFWPDRHNLIKKKINGLLKSDDELTVERIDKASVVVQGLSALEFLLFDQNGGQLNNYSSKNSSDNDNKDGVRRCQLLTAISAHTQGVAKHLYQTWKKDGGNYSGHLSHPGENNIEFPEANTAIAALVDTLVATIELAKKDKLEGPLSIHTKGNRARPYLSEAWRSRASLQLLRANLQAARRLFNGGALDKQHYGFDDYLTGNTIHTTLAESINTQFQQVDDIFSTLQKPLFEAVNDPASQQALKQLQVEVIVLTKLLKYKLPPAMGVTLGFNANDGD